MKLTPIKAIEVHFTKIRHPHINRIKEQILIDIIVIANCAIICEAQSWTDDVIALFSRV